ncbi:MAG: hypothetical protein ACRBBN_09630 [Methyloligellaceae bacterium]
MALPILEEEHIPNDQENNNQTTPPNKKHKDKREGNMTKEKPIILLIEEKFRIQKNQKALEIINRLKEGNNWEDNFESKEKIASFIVRFISRVIQTTTSEEKLDAVQTGIGKIVKKNWSQENTLTEKYIEALDSSGSPEEKKRRFGDFVYKEIYCKPYKIDTPF